jgi:hypothetical protein
VVQADQAEAVGRRAAAVAEVDVVEAAADRQAAVLQAADEVDVGVVAVARPVCCYRCRFST